MNIIEVENAGVGYGNKCVVEDINLSITAGGFVFFLGNNGSGKTTLVKSLLGLISPLKGKVRTLVSRGEIGYIPQRSKLELNLPMTLYEFVSLGSVGKNLSNKRIKFEIEAVLARVDLLEKKNCQLLELSGGELQRGSVARAIFGSPRLLIADEPTNGLDRDSFQSLVSILERLNLNGVTIIVITHDHLLVEKADKEVVYFDNGTATKGHKSC